MFQWDEVYSGSGFADDVHSGFADDVHSGFAGAEYLGSGDRVLVGTGWNMFVDIMVSNNWTGDGHPSVLGRTSTGDLYLYTTDGHGDWITGVGRLIASGWNVFNMVY